MISVYLINVKSSKSYLHLHLRTNTHTHTHAPPLVDKSISLGLELPGWGTGMAGGLGYHPGSYAGSSSSTVHA